MADGRITWLGQAGVRIEFGGAVAVVDPWLSPHEDRLIPSAPLELAADAWPPAIPRSRNCERTGSCVRSEPE